MSLHSLCDPGEIFWGHGMDALEHAREVKRIGKPEFGGDFLDQCGRVAQQFSGKTESV